MTVRDMEYFARREREEREHAERSDDMTARRVHLEMADRYSARLRDIAVAGGVSANSGLRNGVVEEGRRRGWRTFVPEFRFTTDNAAMIAVAGYYHYLHGDFSSLDVSPVARIEELM